MILPQMEVRHVNTMNVYARHDVSPSREYPAAVVVQNEAMIGNMLRMMLN